MMRAPWLLALLLVAACDRDPPTPSGYCRDVWEAEKIAASHVATSLEEKLFAQRIKRQAAKCRAHPQMIVIAF